MLFCKLKFGISQAAQQAAKHTGPCAKSLLRKEGNAAARQQRKAIADVVLLMGLSCAEFIIPVSIALQGQKHLHGFLLNVTACLQRQAEAVASTDAGGPTEAVGCWSLQYQPLCLGASDTRFASFQLQWVPQSHAS